MSNQGPAQEPTMEEILASIRRIISEDTGKDEKEEVAEAAPPPPLPAEEELPAAELDDVDFDVEEEVLELTEALPEEPAVVHSALPEPELEPETEFEPEPEPAPASVAAAEYEPEPAFDDIEEDIAFGEPVMSAQPTPGSAYTQPTQAHASGGSLLSNDAAGAASAAFGALASTLMTSSGGSRTLEDLVADLLKPMLKQWLDHNLPPLVEQLVREEIERVARGGRR